MGSEVSLTLRWGEAGRAGAGTALGRSPQAENSEIPMADMGSVTLTNIRSHLRLTDLSWFAQGFLAPGILGIPLVPSKRT